MVRIIHSAKVITPHEVIHDGAVVVSDNGTILYVGAEEGAPPSDGERMDLQGLILTAGFNDIHVHGGKGVTFGVGDLKSELEAYSRWVVSSGVTGFLLSIAAPDADSLVQLISAYVPVLEAGLPGAEALGLHLEGPFLTKEKKGAFNPAWLRPPAMDEADAYLKAGKGWIRQMTIAPENPGAAEIATYCRRQGVVAAIGHTNTDYATASAALRGDFTHVTHTFNAQSGFDHRAPGVIGAILTSDDITAELIADTIHVHAGAMKLLLRCLGKDRVALITDAMAGAGLSDGDYDLVGQRVFVRDGKATLENGTIAGSTALFNQCVRNIVKEVGIAMQSALQMANYNPARAIGMENKVGSISEGRQANLTVLDEDANIRLTMVKGQIIFDEI